MLIDGCEMFNCSYNGGIITNGGALLRIVNSKVYGSVAGLNIGAPMNVCELENVELGNPSENTDADIYVNSGMSVSLQVRGKSVTLASSTKVYFKHSTYESFKNFAEVFIEDFNGEKGRHYRENENFVAESDNTVYTGNAGSSIKVTPKSSIHELNMRPVFEWKIAGVSGGVEHMVTVYVKGSGWSEFPTADELYIEVEYYDEATGTHTAKAKSSEVLDANDVWKAFTVTFTPAQDGDIYVRGYLKKYESGAVVWFNGEVEIT